MKIATTMSIVALMATPFSAQLTPPGGWTQLTTVGAPSARAVATAVFTRIDGTDHMIVWGGQDSIMLPFANTGGRYKRREAAWSSTTTTNAPAGRIFTSSIWTGRQMIVWGGDDGVNFYRSGGRYDPLADQWSSTSLSGAPSARVFNATVWTGDRMIVWGGATSFVVSTNTGGVYDPFSDTWATTTTTGAPSARNSPMAVWTGNRMIVWGGYATLTGVSLGDGAIYDPGSDTWSSMSTTNAPSPRGRSAVTWDGTHMLIWGGEDDVGVLGDGKTYQPATDTWHDVTSTGAPSARSSPTAVLGADRSLVWGGYDGSGNPLGTGGRYNRLNNTWANIQTSGAPAARYRHTAVWDGERMIVFGGLGAGSNQFLGDCYAYRP